MIKVGIAMKKFNRLAKMNNNEEDEKESSEIKSNSFFANAFDMVNSSQMQRNYTVQLLGKRN